MVLDYIREILSIFSTAASSVVIAIVAALLIYSFKLLCNRFGINISNDAMTEIIGIVSQVVKYLDQKFVDTIKKNSVDGTLTDYQKNMIKDKSIDIIKSILDSKQIDFLLEKYNMTEINDVLDILIESTIKDVRSVDNETIIVNNSNMTDNLIEKNSDNISKTYKPTEDELLSIDLCPGNCNTCTLREECIICRG